MYKFPASGKRNLKFQYSWLSRWKWLSYSQVEDGAFCKFCVLFSVHGGGVGHQPLGKLSKKKFCNWKDAVEEFNRHQNTEYHKTCLLRASQLQNISCIKKHDSVDIQVNVGLKKQIEENRSRMIPIIETVVLCGRQGIALRGHRDSGPINLEEVPLQNDGNFRSLLRFKAKSGDTELENHLKFSSQNAMYTSPQIQNEIIEACNNIILNTLVKKVNNAKCFTVLADETTDISGIEQLSLCVRYIDESSEKIREDFLQFVPVFDVSGKGLANTILEAMNNVGLNATFLRGQGYDGAASMRGQFNGVQAHVSSVHPLAVYLHCSSHSLNLAVTSACSVQAIRNCMGTVGNISTFFKYPKRLNVLQQSIEKNVPEANPTRLKSLCPTRWIERHDSVIIFLQLFDAVIDGLEVISMWPDSVASTNANQLLCAAKQPEFLVALYVTDKLFSISLPLSRLLQTENIDLVEAMESAVLVEEAMKDLRENAQTEFHKLFMKVEKKANDIEVDVIAPRRAGRQLHRVNILSASEMTESAEDYYRAAIFIPFADNFIMQLGERLLAHRKLLNSFMCLLPKQSTKPTAADEESMKELVKTYMSDVTCSEQEAIGELQIWYRLLASRPQPPTNAFDAYFKCSETQFPTVKTLLRILTTLPVTTATNERSFSSLKRLKSYLRNSMEESRLNGLALLNIHHDIHISPSEVLDEFSKKPRRLNFRLF